MDIQRTEIEKLLRSYLEKKSRMRFIELDIEGLQNMLAYQGKESGESKDKAIEGLSLHASVISDMPGGGNKEYQSSTERVALTIDNRQDNHFDTDAVYSKINTLQREYKDIEVDVRKADIFLDSLTEKERFIAEKFYIHRWTWEEVTQYYNQKMPIARQKNALKECQLQLLEKIKRVSA
jgi:hypothetical protein